MQDGQDADYWENAKYLCSRALASVTLRFPCKGRIGIRRPQRKKTQRSPDCNVASRRQRWKSVRLAPPTSRSPREFARSECPSLDRVADCAATTAEAPEPRERVALDSEVVMGGEACAVSDPIPRRYPTTRYPTRSPRSFSQSLGNAANARFMTS